MRTTALLGVLLAASPAAVQEDESALKARHAEILQFLRTAREERQLRAAAEELRRLAERAFEQDGYALAERLLADAVRAARPARDADLVSTLQERLGAVRAAAREYEKVRRLELRLSSEGNLRPDEYLILGKFYALIKGDWSKGIPAFSRGSDPKLKEAADADQAGAEAPDAKLIVGERWWECGEAYRERALHWYRDAWPGLSGIAREKARARFRERFFRPARPIPGLPPYWIVPHPPENRVFLEGRCANSGERSIRLTPGPYAALWTPAVSVKGGKKYVLGASTLSEGTKAPVTVLLLRFDGKEIPFTIDAPPDQPWWTRREVTFECPAGARSAEVFIGFSFPEGTIWVDDVSLKDEAGTELLPSGSFEK